MICVTLGLAEKMVRIRNGIKVLVCELLLFYNNSHLTHNLSRAIGSRTIPGTGLEAWPGGYASTAGSTFVGTNTATATGTRF